MISLDRPGYNTIDIRNQLHGKNGAKYIKFRYDLKNRYEVKIGELTASNSGNSINFNSLSDIKRTGMFSFKENELKDVNWLYDRIQPIFQLKMPDNNYVEFPLGIFILSSPTRKDNNGEIWREVEAYDASVILKEDKFDNRYKLSQGTNYIDAIITMLNNIGISKTNIVANNATLKTDKEFEIGVSLLEAINSLLTEINYTSLWVDINGYFISRPYVLPSSREAEYEYETGEFSIIEDGAANSFDLYSIPNKWVITASNPESQPLTSIYVNDSLISITSTVNRGRILTDFRQIDSIYSQEVLDDYTKRIAYNASNVYEKFSFNTCLMPHHDFMNVLYVEYRNLNIASKFVETEWSMDLQIGGKMNHNVRRAIQII